MEKRRITENIYVNITSVFSPELEKSKLVQIIGFLMGILTISFIFWNRLIRERLPRDITDVEVYSLGFWVILYLFIIFTGISIYTVNKLQRTLRGVANKESFIYHILKNFLVKSLHKLFTKKQLQTGEKFYYTISGYLIYVGNGPYFLFKFTYLNLSHNAKIKKYMRNRMHYLVNGIVDQTYPVYGNFLFRLTITIFIFVYLPRIIVSTIFVYEIINFKKLELFYTIVWILLIPLIVKAFISVLNIGTQVEIYNLQQKLFIDFEEINFDKTGLLKYVLDFNAKIQENNKHWQTNFAHHFEILLRKLFYNNLESLFAGDNMHGARKHTEEEVRNLFNSWQQISLHAKYLHLIKIIIYESIFNIIAGSFAYTLWALGYGLWLLTILGLF